MSVLICSLCEENRDAITIALHNAVKILGTKATGSCPFFSHLICKDCQQLSKKFEFLYVLGQHHLKYQIESNEKTEYVISLKNPADSTPPINLDINLLSIINDIKHTLDHLHVNEFGCNKGFANDQSFWLWIKNSSTRVYCTCGGSNF